MSVIKNIKEISLIPNEPDKEISKLLPTVMHAYEGTFEIHNVNVAVANGIRRVMLSELPVKALWYDDVNFSTTNPFTLNDFTLTRIRNIPILQNVDDKFSCSLDVVNNTIDVLMVKSGQMKSNKPLPFNETFTIAALEPNSSLHIKDIVVKTDYGYNFAGHSVACNVVCVPMDLTPYNGFTKTGTKSSISDPRNHRITFVSNGNMSSKNIIVASCSEIINRLKLIYDVLDEISFIQDTHVLIIKGETDTIGNLIMKTICEIYPDITACVYEVDTVAKKLTIRLRTQQSPKDIIKKALDANIATYTSLMKSI